MSLEITSVRRVRPENPKGQWLIEVTLSNELTDDDICKVRVTEQEMRWYRLFQLAVKRQTNIDFECMHLTPGAGSQQQELEWCRYVAPFRKQRVAEAIREAESGSRPAAEAEDQPSEAKNEGEPSPEPRPKFKPRPPLRRPAGRRVIDVRPQIGRGRRRRYRRW
jgi:hypothetical protein